MTVAQTKPYPFDLAELRKGSVVAPEEVERVSGVSRGDTKRYGLALLRVQEMLSKQWRRERGEVITTRATGDSIVICTDEEAARLNPRRFRAHIAGQRRDLRRQADVDRSALTTDEARNGHERSLVTMAAFLSGAKRAERVALKAHERKTPGLEASKKH